MKARLVPVLVVLLAGTGCERHFFQPHGDFVVEDGPDGSSRGPIQGCVQAPMHPEFPSSSSTIVSFMWSPRVFDDERGRRHVPQINVPLELDLARPDGQLTGTLATLHTPLGDRLDAHSCRTLSLTTHEGPPELPGGRPTMAGTLDLDCTIRSAHVTAHVRFSGCEY